MAAGILLGLDVGSVRIGVARARADVRIPQPLTTLLYDETIFERLAQLVKDEQVSVLVVGWPRNLQGQDTGQTHFVETFVEQLRQHVQLPVHLQDEALTSQKAEAELQARRKPYEKGEVDALAATFILDDYLATEETAGRV